MQGGAGVIYAGAALFWKSGSVAGYARFYHVLFFPLGLLSRKVYFSCIDTSGSAGWRGIVVRATPVLFASGERLYGEKYGVLLCAL